MKAGAGASRRHYIARDRTIPHVRTALQQLAARYQSDKTARFIIIGLAAANLTIILLHTLNDALLYFGFEYNFLLQRYFNVTTDWGYAEIFNYLQATGCAALLFGAFRASRQHVYLAWALVFAFVVVDDALGVHERVGSALDAALDLPALPGLRPQDTGELVTWGAAGALLLAVLAWGFRTSRPEAVGFGVVFGLIFALLVFFGVGVDMLHVVFARVAGPRVVSHLFALVEDGGEMLMVAAACAGALLLYRLSTAAPDTGAARSPAGDGTP